MSEFNQDMLGDMAIEALERTAFVSAEPADSEFLDELDREFGLGDVNVGTDVTADAMSETRLDDDGIR